MLRTATLAACAAAVVLAPLTGPPAEAANPPRTGFEESDGTRWTGEQEEAEFLATVAEDSERVAVDRIGTTEQGRPLNLVRIGAPRPPTPAEAARGSVVLLICSQHGDEPAYREACLTSLRDLAYAKDAETRRFLARNSVLVVPSANPDGRAADTRGNADGVDVNRDHVALETAEGRAMAAVIRDYRPDVVHDLHEFDATEPYYVKDVLALWPRNLNTHDAVHREARHLTEDHVRAGCRGSSTTAAASTASGPTRRPASRSARSPATARSASCATRRASSTRPGCSSRPASRRSPTTSAATPPPTTAAGSPPSSPRSTPRSPTPRTTAAGWPPPPRRPAPAASPTPVPSTSAAPTTSRPRPARSSTTRPAATNSTPRSTTRSATSWRCTASRSANGRTAARW